VDPRRLEAFVLLAQELNFTRAAHQLHITQSTLSASMKALESELGVTLFARSTRSVSLTDAGRTFLPRARAAIEAIDSARASVSQTGELRGSLTVGMLTGLTLVDVPSLVGEFHRRHPQVRLRLQTARRGAAQLAEDVAQGLVDVAFVGGMASASRLRTRAIRKYDLRLVVPQAHRLAGRRDVTLDDLADEPFVDMPVGFGHRTVIDAAFAHRSLQRNVLVEVADLTTIGDYVQNGLGVALLPPEIARRGDDALVTVPISDSAITWTLAVAFSAEYPSSRSVNAFLDLIPSHIRSERAF
jgi:DNA-binding transcriptional LysR family regulator